MKIEQEVQTLYDQNLFLQAHARSIQFWREDFDVALLSPEALILGGRLAARLGGPRLSRHLFRMAVLRAPELPEVRYFARHADGRRFRNIHDLLHDFETHPELLDGTPALRASWLAGQAVLWGRLGDFERADACLGRAAETGDEASWISACSAEVHSLADRWSEALAAAERSWSLSPGAPHAARALGSSLTRLDRMEEAAQRLATAADGSESYEVVSVACWQLCAWAERLSGPDPARSAALARATALAARLPTLMPLADRESRSEVARVRLDLADLAGDLAEVRRLAEEIDVPFYRRVVANTEANREGRRLRLPFRRVLQKYKTCLPSSTAAALSALGVAIDADELANQLTHDGTPTWAVAGWLEQQGLQVRHFRCTPNRAAALLRAGLPFVLTLEFESHAHAVAVVGLDEAAGTLLVHDPSSPRESEYLLDGFGTEEAPLGPNAFVAVPTLRAADLDDLLCPDDVATVSALASSRRAAACEGPSAVRAIVDALAERLPDHAVTRCLRAECLLDEARFGEALEAFRDLLREHPRCLRLRRGLIGSCRALGNTSLLRDTLADVVNRGVLPGIEKGQEWRSPPSIYVCEYADLLRMSAHTRNVAQGLLLGVLRREPLSAAAWHNLADGFLPERRPADVLLEYRIASCLDRHAEHYARAYCDALRDAGREEDGLAWLERRAGSTGLASDAAGTWLTWIEALEHYGWPERALDVYRQAAVRCGREPVFLAFGVAFLVRMGLWDEAAAGLRTLELSGARPDFLNAAAEFHLARGDVELAHDVVDRWVREVPRDLRARSLQLANTANRAGRRAAVELARRWVDAAPGHDELEHLLYTQWVSVEDQQAATELLEQRSRRNPEDAWAWRERAYRAFAEYERADAVERPKREPDIAALLANCDRTGGCDPAARRVHAAWLEARGLWQEAVEAWTETVASDPTCFHGCRRAWECAARLDGPARAALLARMETLLSRSTERLHAAREFLVLVSGRFGVAEAEKVATRWLAQRPSDPEVVEAAANLLLDCGHGRSDAARAFALLETAVARFPYHVELRLSLAHACRALGRDTEAERVFGELESRHPGNVHVRIQLALLAERRGARDEALRALDTATAISPLDGAVWWARADLLLRAQNPTDAVAVLEEALRRAPENTIWRAHIVDTLIGCARPTRAVAVAREGVHLTPTAAHLWLLLADTLSRAEGEGQAGEIEACLRRSLACNASYYAAADRLAVLLGARRNYDEAAAVVTSIRPFLSDPSPADGRLAAIAYARGDHQAAREAMAAVVGASPTYEWGWERLMEWLTADKCWEEARRLLIPAPTELNADLGFRVNRVRLLTQAQTPVADTEAEWTQLLADFPENEPLHLERFDGLMAAKHAVEAAAVLERIKAVVPDSPYVLARIAEDAVRRLDHQAALDACARVWLREAEQSTWPTAHAWEMLGRLGPTGAAIDHIRRRVTEGAPLTPHALCLLADAYAAREPRYGCGRAPVWRRWWPGPGAREILGLLETLDGAAWGDGGRRGALLERLGSCGYYRAVVAYGRRHPNRVAAETAVWAQVGRALLVLDRRAARRWLEPWRTRAGVDLWSVCNYALTLPRRGSSALRFLADTCQTALDTLPHDHTAKYVAHVWAEACLRSGDEDLLRNAWPRYRSYFTGGTEAHEWFAPTQRHLLPMVAKLGQSLDDPRPGRAHRAFWILRWRLRLGLYIAATHTQSPAI